MATATETAPRVAPAGSPGVYPPHPEGLIGGSYDTVTLGDKIADVLIGDTPTPKAWWGFFLFGFALLQALVLGLAYLFYAGTGVWGINQPVA